MIQIPFYFSPRNLFTYGDEWIGYSFIMDDYGCAIAIYYDDLHEFHLWMHVG